MVSFKRNDLDWLSTLASLPLSLPSCGPAGPWRFLRALSFMCFHLLFSPPPHPGAPLPYPFTTFKLTSPYIRPYPKCQLLYKRDSSLSSRISPLRAVTFKQCFSDLPEASAHLSFIVLLTLSPLAQLLEWTTLSHFQDNNMMLVLLGRCLPPSYPGSG